MILALSVATAERFVGRRRARTEVGGGRRPLQVGLGRWRRPSLAAVTGVVTLGLFAPVGVLGYWALRGLQGEAVAGRRPRSALRRSTRRRPRTPSSYRCERWTPRAFVVRDRTARVRAPSPVSTCPLPKAPSATRSPPRVRCARRARPSAGVGLSAENLPRRDAESTRCAYPVGGGRRLDEGVEDFLPEADLVRRGGQVGDTGPHGVARAVAELAASDAACHAAPPPSPPRLENALRA